MADDYRVRHYQDEIDSDTEASSKELQSDIITEEETDDLASRAGVPPEVLREGFRDMEGENDDSPLGTQDDLREEAEDEDENIGMPGRG